MAKQIIKFGDCSAPLGGTIHLALHGPFHTASGGHPPLQFWCGHFSFSIDPQPRASRCDLFFGGGSRVQDESRHLAPVAAFLATHHLIRRERWISG